MNPPGDTNISRLHMSEESLVGFLSRRADNPVLYCTVLYSNVLYRQSVIILLLVTVSSLPSLLVINQAALNVESRRSISSICIKYGIQNMEYVMCLSCE